MTRIHLDPPTLETLRHRNEPAILCDPSGRELGTFAPDRNPSPADPPEESDGSSRRDREPWAGLGGSVGIYGYAADLE